MILSQDERGSIQQRDDNDMNEEPVFIYSMYNKKEHTNDNDMNEEPDTTDDECWAMSSKLQPIS